MMCLPHNFVQIIPLLKVFFTNALLIYLLTHIFSKMTYQIITLIEAFATVVTLIRLFFHIYILQCCIQNNISTTHLSQCLHLHGFLPVFIIKILCYVKNLVTLAALILISGICPQIIDNSQCNVKLFSHLLIDIVSTLRVSACGTYNFLSLFITFHTYRTLTQFIKMLYQYITVKFTID